MSKAPFARVVLIVGAAYTVCYAILIWTVATRYSHFLQYYVPDVTTFLGSQALIILLIACVILEPRVQSSKRIPIARPVSHLFAAGICGALIAGETFLGIGYAWPTAAGCAIGAVIALVRPNMGWPTTVEGAALAGIAVMLGFLLIWDVHHFDELKTFPVELAIADHVWSCMTGAIAAAAGALALGSWDAKLQASS